MSKARYEQGSLYAQSNLSLNLDGQVDGKSGFLGGVVNLLNLMIGGAILGMPYAAANLGWQGFIVFSIVVAAVSFFTADLLVQVAYRLGVSTYEEVAEIATKRLTGRSNYGCRFVGFCLFLTAFLVVQQMGFVVKSQMPELFKTLLIKFGSATDCVSPDVWWLNGNWIYLIITICITLPITMRRDLDFLKWPSLVGMVSMFVTIIILCCFKFQISCQDVIADEVLASNQTARALSQNGTSSCSYPPNPVLLKDWPLFESKIEQAANSSLGIGGESLPYCYSQGFIFNDYFTKSFSVLFYAWMSHAGILCIYDSLAEQTRSNFLKVNLTGYLICLLMNIAIGLGGYLTWYELTISDILLMYSKTSGDNLWIFACRVFVNMTTLFSIPMILFFGRAGFFSMIKRGDKSEGPSSKALAAYNVVFLGVTYVCSAFLADSLGKLMFLGGLICAAFGLLLPPAIWLTIFKDDRTEHKISFYGASIVLAFGILFFSNEVVNIFVQ